MTQALPRTDGYAVRGWCPTARRPMRTGDGLIVRLNAHRKSLTPVDLLAIANLAERHGNGLIDLTRRANMQLRGVEDSSLPLLWRELADIELLDDGPGTRANILTGPLAGHDPTEVTDSLALANSLSAAIAADPALASLPDKFLFLVDGGGLLPLDDDPADIRLRALRVDGHVVIAFGIDGVDGVRWLGTTTPSAAVDVAVELAAALLRHRPAIRRMRDLSDDAVPALLPLGLAPIEGLPQRAAHRPLGVFDVAPGKFAAGIAAPFGRTEASALRKLAEAAAGLGISEFRVSPWRSMYALADNRVAAAEMVATAAGTGFIVDADDPLLAIDACPGAPACNSSSIDTRAVAVALAPQLATMGVASCHISGCSKGCARSSTADLTLVGASGSYAVVRHGTARSTPCRVVRRDELASLPLLLKST